MEFHRRHYCEEDDSLCTNARMEEDCCAPRHDLVEHAVAIQARRKGVVVDDVLHHAQAHAMEALRMHAPLKPVACCPCVSQIALDFIVPHSLARTTPCKGTCWATHLDHLAVLQDAAGCIRIAAVAAFWDAVVHRVIAPVVRIT
jgi:hypothetical protein